MPTKNFKLNRHAAVYPFAWPTNRTARPVASHTVPVAEMASPLPSPTLPPIDREDIADAAEIARLLALPFPIFTQAVARLLQCLGYTDVQTMKAMHGQGKGRNQHGGYDLRMYLPTRLTRNLVIAQVKQYKEAVPRSFVDELRGTMLRLGASQGLLVTTGAFSASAIEAAQAAQYAAPVRLMDGTELARLLREHPQAHGSVPSPAPIPTAPSFASRLRPISREEGDRLHQEFLDGLGAPPDTTAPATDLVQPSQGKDAFALHIDVYFAPAPFDARHGSTADTSAGERRRV